nr:hypothetical protein Q903MT_gene3569 [Picea sitchensis]
MRMRVWLRFVDRPGTTQPGGRPAFHLVPEYGAQNNKLVHRRESRRE